MMAILRTGPKLYYLVNAFTFDMWLHMNQTHLTNKDAQHIPNSSCILIRLVQNFKDPCRHEVYCLQKYVHCEICIQKNYRTLAYYQQGKRNRTE
jgi:hypothetical protein